MSKVEIRSAPQEAAPPPEPCAECGGRGWVIEADGGAGAARPCECRKRNLGARLLGQAGIPERYAACRLENFKIKLSKGAAVQDELLKALRIAEVYVEEFLDPESGEPSDAGLIFFGQTGSGKTHLATAVLAEVITRYNVRGRFEDLTRLFSRLQNTFDNAAPESRHRILGPVLKAEILLLDELGFRRATDWMKEVLRLIIDTRYSRRLPTLFTTNYPLQGEAGGTDVFAEIRNPDRQDPLAARISSPLVSRICEMARPVRLDCWDYRIQMMNQNRSWS